MSRARNAILVELSCANGHKWEGKDDGRRIRRKACPDCGLLDVGLALKMLDELGEDYREKDDEFSIEANEDLREARTGGFRN